VILKGNRFKGKIVLSREEADAWTLTSVTETIQDGNDE
jgi:hypothetical protein